MSEEIQHSPENMPESMPETIKTPEQGEISGNSGGSIQKPEEQVPAEKDTKVLHTETLQNQGASLETKITDVPHEVLDSKKIEEKTKKLSDISEKGNVEDFASVAEQYNKLRESHKKAA